MTSSCTAASAKPRATGNASMRIVAVLRNSRGRRNAAGAIRQARRRLPDASRRAARADRELEPRAALGDVGAFQRARPQRSDDVRPDDGRFVDLHRLARHRARHVRDVRRDGPAALRRRLLAGAGSSPPASAAWAARSRSPRRWPALRCSRSSAIRRGSRRRLRRAISIAAPLARRSARIIARRAPRARPFRSDSPATQPTFFPNSCAAACGPTS
jgi:hypothetical protein